MTTATKVVFQRCEELGIELDVVWTPRESPMLMRVDALSKANTTWVLAESAASVLTRAFGTVPVLPEFASVGSMLSAVIARQSHVLLIVPQWPAASWWPLLWSSASSVRPVGEASSLFAYEPRKPYPPWSFVAAVFGKLLT
jgi:hypothetical protein